MAIPIIVRLKKIDRLFVVFVFLPVLIATMYFGFFATDVYISESKFVVRSPEKPAASGLGMVLAGAGFTNAGEESFAAKSYVESRDALRAVNAREAFRKAFTRDTIWIAERFNALGFAGSFEDLYKYYLNRVEIDSDTTTSISTLFVRAYTPGDARWINERLLQMSEQTVNRMNERGRADLIRFAQVEVDDAQDRARRTSLALAAYRNRAGVVDPDLQANVQVGMISKLQDELIATRAQLNQLREFTPLNPQIPVMVNRFESLEREIGEQMQSLTGGDKSLAASAVQYQRLFLENQFSDKQLTSALVSLQEARNEARRQQVYVERIAQPNLPDAPLEPRRWRGIFATLALGLVAWGIASMLVVGVREHGQ
jgi:capsular polysaccharide transport system permease protein